MTAREHRIIAIGRTRKKLDVRALADLIVAAADHDLDDRGDHGGASAPHQLQLQLQLQLNPTPVEGDAGKQSRRRWP